MWVTSGKYKELKIFGNDWPTNDGTCVRDYIHVMDLAESHLCALEFLLEENSKYELILELVRDKCFRTFRSI